MLGPGTRVLERHRRWLFAVSRCRTADGRDLYLKRQPPMGRSIEQLRWQHRLTNHLADRGVPAARALGLVEQDGFWYELLEPAAGTDAYAGADSWDPFGRDVHVAAAGEMLARLHRSRRGLLAARPPATGRVRRAARAGRAGRRGGGRGALPAAPGGRRVPARPGLAGARRGRLRPPAGARRRAARAAGGAAAARRLADQQPVLRGRPADRGDRLPPGGLRAADSCRPGGGGQRNCFFWNRISAGDDRAYDLCQAAVLVAAYDAVEPLAADERAAFPDVLAACQFEYGISFLDYYWGVERDREKADWAWHTFVLGHAEWWASPAGREAAAAIGRIVSADR